MHDRIRNHFAGLIKALTTTQLTDERKEIVGKAIERLDALYARYRATNESRSGDQITAIVQSVLKELEACPRAADLDAAFREGLHGLHEELGIPKLPLKSAPARKKTAAKSAGKAAGKAAK